MSKVNIGLVQMSCTASKEENLQKAVIRVNEAAKKGAQIICLQELFTSLYFCDEENYDNFKMAEPIPGPSTEALTRAAKENQVVIIASLFETVTILASIAKCIFRMILLTMKNFISLPVILGIKFLKQNLQTSAC